MQEGAKATLA
jgi:hypothetical protein